MRNCITVKRKEITPNNGFNLEAYCAIEIRFVRNDFKIIGEEDLPFKEYFRVGDRRLLDQDCGAEFETLEEALDFFNKSCDAIIAANGGLEKCRVVDGWS